MDEFGGVLAFCNDVRSGLRRQPVPKLRKGQRGDSCRCAVAATINYKARNLVKVDYWGVAIMGKDDIAKPTPLVMRFVNDFDKGEFPELEGSGWAT